MPLGRIGSGCGSMEAGTVAAAAAIVTRRGSGSMVTSSSGSGSCRCSRQDASDGERINDFRGTGSGVFVRHGMEGRIVLFGKYSRQRLVQIHLTYGVMVGMGGRNFCAGGTSSKYLIELVGGSRWSVVGRGINEIDRGAGVQGHAGWAGIVLVRIGIVIAVGGSFKTVVVWSFSACRRGRPKRRKALT